MKTPYAISVRVSFAVQDLQSDLTHLVLFIIYVLQTVDLRIYSLEVVRDDNT